MLDLVKKVFYPYEYISDFTKSEDKLPSTKKFYSLLTGKETTDNDCKHAVKVWNAFEKWK